MLCREIIDVCAEIHTKHINTLTVTDRIVRFNFSRDHFTEVLDKYRSYTSHSDVARSAFLRASENFCKDARRHIPHDSSH